MNKPNQERSIAKSAADIIRRHHITPKSFVIILFEKIGYAVLFLVVFGVLVLVVNLLADWFRVTGIGNYLAHGLIGIFAVTLSLPYTLLAIAILAFILTMILLRHYDISYKSPMILLAAVILLVSVGLGTALARTGVNERVRPLAQVHQKNRQFTKVTARSLVGIVTEKTDDEIRVTTHLGTIRVILTDETRYASDVEKLSVGARVHVLGVRSRTGEFRALIVIIPKVTSQHWQPHERIPVRPV